MNNYEAKIGLEVHAQLKTKSKIFCGCSAEFGLSPNSLTCPVCLGLPGVLPVLNKEALELAVKAALSLNCKINKILKFDRKNYFYPDLPKNFQISQYDMPLACNGWIEVDSKKIRIRRVHLEEDAGKLIHKDYSLLDFNRCGIPLLEIVTEPDLGSPQEAYRYLLDLKSILEYLEVSDCNMEEGSLRCDANISVKLKEREELGLKVELKNMNSFKAIRSALEFEMARQIKILKEGGQVVRETRLWDEKKSSTFLMRVKEEEQDYRYFPEPDLVPFVIEEDFLKRVENTLPELPQQKMNRFVREYKISEYDAKILIGDKQLAFYFERCVKLYAQTKNLVNWLTGPLLSELNSRKIQMMNLKISPKDFIYLLEQVDKGKISALKAKEVLSEMVVSGEDPEGIIKRKGIEQISKKDVLEDLVDKVLREEEKSIQDYLKGKENAIMYLVGSVMKSSSGKANPKVILQMLKKKLAKFKRGE